MANMMKTLKKAAIGTVATGAMLMAAASPAQAQNRGDRYDRDRDGISAGEIIAGVVVLGGLAAILSSGDNDRYDNRGYDGRDYRGGDYGYDNGRYDNGRYNGGYDYNRYGNSRQAINQCVNAVNQRSSYKRGARVDQVTRVERTGKGYKIEGRVSTNDRYGNDRYNNGRYNDGRYNDGRYNDRNDGRYGNYDNRYGNDRYGYNNYNRDTGSFSCTVKYGRVDKLKVRGV